jgi:hypothetical protein
MSTESAHESNQGHQAKMNSSDWSGLQDSDAEGGWTSVVSKSSKRMLRKKQNHMKGKQPKVDNSSSDTELSSRSNPRSRAPSRFGEPSSSSENALRDDQGPLAQELAVVQEAAAGESVSISKRGKRSRSTSKAAKSAVVPETPSLVETPEVEKSSKVRVVRVNAADGKTLGECISDSIKNGKRCKPRDIDPSSKPPAPTLVRQVAEMLLEDSSTALPVELGIPSTTRREAALKRLKRILEIKHLDAEKLLTCSALTHDDGKENYQHALALGKYLKYGESIQDEAEARRIYLRKQVQKLGYSAAQANLAIQDLEVSLGLQNVTAMEVQGWLVRQAVAYNQAHNNASNASNASSLVCNGSRCAHGDKMHPLLRNADTILRNHGMNDVAAALHQAASTLSPSTKISNRPAVSQNPGAQALLDTVNNLQRDGEEKDPFWDKPPAVKLFLLAREALWVRMQQISTMPAGQLLRVFNTQVATWPTFLEAVQHFPGACGVKYELSEVLQRHIEEAKIGIRDLELGSRLFLADMLERNTDLIMRNSNGHVSRKLAEAEFVRAFKRSGDSNQAVQSVCQALKAPSVPTPSWKETVGEINDTPRALGASYRIGQQNVTSTSARRKIAGRETARMAAQQEMGVEASTPPTEGRYRNADAISTLRKMLKEDPELSNLPAEQQLRIAARRVNRHIDFSVVPVKESSSSKRSASQREDDSEDEEANSTTRKEKVSLKAKMLPAHAEPEDGEGDGSSSGSVSSSQGGDDSGDGSTGDKENSDEEGSACVSGDEDSRESDEEYESDDGFCVPDDVDGEEDVGASMKTKRHKQKVSKSASSAVKVAEAIASKRDSNVNSLGTPKKSEGASSVSQGGNIYFGEDELKKWTTGSEKYKQGFNWPAYIHHKQNYDNYCQFKGVHAARTFKSVIHAKLVPALCSFCGLKRLKWKTYEDATVILAIEKTLRPSKSTDFALELKQIQIADDRELSLMQNYTCFFENFSCKVAEAEDANRAIKPNVVKSTFKTAISGYEILKLWLEEVPWRGLDKANARLLRKLREVRSWEQLQRKGLTSSVKKRRTDEGENEEAKPRQEGRKTFRGTRAGKALSLKKRVVRPRGNGRALSNFGSAGSSDKKRSFSKPLDKRADDRRKHPGLDQRGESWHENKELFECFH